MQQFNMKQKERYKETELGLLPESWGVDNLENEYIGFKNGLWKGEKEPFVKVKVLRNTNFKNDGTIRLNNIAELDVEEKQFKTRNIINGDIILERSGGGPAQPVGRVVFFDIEEGFNYSFSNFTSRIRVVNKEKIFSKYLFYFLLYFYMSGKTNDIQSRTTGIRNLDFSKYKQIYIPLPLIPEQKKIADILSTIQEAKEKTENVINSLKELKKSMMKHLFTYGPVPFKEAKNIKLKDTDIGKLPEEWMIKELKEVAKSRKETINPSEVENKVYVGLEHMSPESIKLLNYGSSSEVRSTKNIFYHGDILYGKLRPYLNKVILSDRKGLSSTDIIIIIAGNINRKYLVYFMKSKAFLEYAISTMTGVNHPRTSWNKLRSFKIPLPSLPIQQKIALVISTIDLKIQKEENKKKALEKLFKSMLHNLMIAKIRVNNLEI